MRVIKFGRSALQSPETVCLIRKNIDSRKEPCIVVVSSGEGMTDLLEKAGQLAFQRKEAYLDILAKIIKIHTQLVQELVPAQNQEKVIVQMKEMISELQNSLHGVYLLQELTPKTLDLIVSYATRLSAFILSHILDNARYHDAREFIKTNTNFGAAKVDMELTGRLIRDEFKTLDHVAVIPGFIGSSYRDETTLLGRRGADYTASLIAATLHAEGLELWMNVDGFMTADPEIASRTHAIERLTYAEAIELSHFGTTVIYTPTIRPVYEENIPILIRNLFNPEAKGTLIYTEDDSQGKSSIKGISSINDIALITLQGTRMVGVNDVTERLFRAFCRHGINVILVTQASSEYSMSLAVLPGQLGKAKSAIESEFLDEIGQKNEIRLQIETDLSIIAIVGESMKNKPGVSASLFNSLARNGISVIATAQGSSELNISVVIRKRSLKKAINAIHESFFLSQYKELHLFIAGLGNVGKSLLKQMQLQQEKLSEELSLRIHVVGIMNSRKMYVEKIAESIDLNHWEDLLAESGEPSRIEKFRDEIFEMNLRNTVFIDCTGSGHICQSYKDMFDNYVSVVTANKIACSSEYSLYKSLKNKAKERGVRFMFETNVGAGLPVINTINDLIHSGDKILKIEAVVSGTLNYIFNILSAEIPLSKAIRMAKEKGFSEPDPRLDLSGTDVIRKLLILARESGYPLERENIEMVPFLPASCFEGSQDDFWKSVEALDAEFETRRKANEVLGKKWRFIASLDHGKASVGLQEVDSSHPSYQLEGSNNIILLTSERYYELPMVIKGYGAGAEVTAAGVFADVIRVANV